MFPNHVLNEVARCQFLIEKSTLSLAGEYAVASELCKRGFYAQVTLGNLKQSDLLVYQREPDRKFGLRLIVEVKSKQGRVWPAIKGISGSDTLLVFVDFEKKKPLERPDFYVLNVGDWRRYINKYIRPLGRREVRIDKDYCPHFKGHRGKQPYERFVGTSVKPDQVLNSKEAWKKFNF